MDLSSHQHLLAVACAWTNPTGSLVVCVTHAWTKCVNPSFWCVTCMYIAEESEYYQLSLLLRSGSTLPLHILN